MKIFTPLLIFFTTILVHPALFALPESSTREDSVTLTKRQYVLVDITGFPVGHTHSASWEPYQSVRIGYGRDLGYLLELRVFAEYTQFDYDNSDAMSYHDYAPGRRRDFALYPAIVAFRFAEIGLGGYYTFQDEVFHWSRYSSQTTIDPMVNKFGIYLHCGASRSIHIAGPVNISLGIFLRNDLKDGTYFGARAGLKYEI